MGSRTLEHRGGLGGKRPQITTSTLGAKLNGACTVSTLPALLEPIRQHLELSGLGEEIKRAGEVEDRAQAQV